MRHQNRGSNLVWATLASLLVTALPSASLGQEIYESAPAATPERFEASPIDPEQLKSAVADGDEGTVTPNAGAANSAKRAREKLSTDKHASVPSWADLQSGSTSSPLALPTGENKSGVTSQTISVPKGAGTIKGMGESFSAQLSTGIATYGVAFALPAARGAAQPDLGLAYSSSAGFGNVGVGWSIEVPFIARQTDRGVPSYEDGSNWHANQDRFVFNGAQELVPICDVGPSLECEGALDGEVMPVWARGWQYHRARVEGAFVRFFWSPDRRTWRAQTKEGVSMELGVPLDGSGYTGALEANPEASGEVYRWFVAREYDVYGVVNPEFGYPRPLNSVYYRYISEGNSVYLSDIYDTTPADDPLTLDFGRFAHHAHLEWEPRPDQTFSYRSGWRMAQTLRLARVDVTSANFGGTGGRRLVRRYDLAYDSAYHVSLLDSVTLRGRCAWGTDGSPPQEVPEVAGSLPKLIPCVTDDLPPLRFGYSHVGPAAPDGFEPFDDQVRTLLNSPSHSVDEQYTDLFDVNSDGLPDVLVTAPGQYGSGHGVFFNGQGGQPETFGNVEPVALQGLLGANASTMSLKNPNLVPLDLDGDGIINLLHMPQAKTYATYAPVETATGWQWQGRVVKTASGLDPLIDFGDDATETQVMDVNFDGLVDVVVSSGSAMRTFFSLGRFPHGDGQFGNANWSSPQTADIRNDPVESCLPWSSEPLRFSDPDVHVAEMNGDGIPDLVRVRRGDVRYWPGRGNGFWGTGNRADCADGTFATGRHIEMADSPSYSDLQGDSLRMDDINGDGLTDLVQVRFDEVDVWLNVNGTGWTQRRIIDNTPASPSYAKRVRLVDVDGSGTRDILWGNGGKYQYIDLEAGSRPWLLTSVENGLGKSTSIEYSTSTDEMLEAEAAGKPWSSRAPMVLHVVKRVTERDNLNVAGLGQRVYVSEYGYRDAVYEPQQREFRGFREATTTDIGDSNSPTSIARSRFLLGECQDEDPSDSANPCAPDEIWRDNPREALKGLSFLEEELDEQGTYASTAHTRYALRTLYTGIDGREVRYAVTTGSTTWLYDTANPAAFSSPSTTSMLTVDGEGQPGKDESYSVTQRAVAGAARIESASVVDEFGNQLEAIMFGCTAGCPGGTSDEVIADHMTPILLPHGSGWLWRNASTYTTGSLHPGRRESQRVEYSPEGAPTAVYAELEGTLPLDRRRPGTPSTAGVDVAALPARASHDTPNLFVSASEFDEFGNIVRSREAGDRCGDTEFDSVYRQYPVVDRMYPSGCPAGSEVPADTLTTAASYDRGFELATHVVDLQGQVTYLTYDGLGRTRELFRPEPDRAFDPDNLPSPSLKYEYLLPPQTGQPYSIVHQLTQDSAAIRTDAASESYHEKYEYIDGLGRTLVVLGEADPQAGDAADWVVGGFTEFDAQGATRRVYLDYYWDGDPLAFDLTGRPDSPYGRTRYDAFGRAIQTMYQDGTISLQTAYHALAVDNWDAADLAAGPHHGTYLTSIQDGHGRDVRAIERFRLDGVLVQRFADTSYLPTGEIEVVTRSNSVNPERVVRWARYDSLGRMVLNVDPHASVGFSPDPSTDPATIHAWRYAYQDSGELVATSDPRGCGQNFAHDHVGRLLSEDYSPCEPHHPTYSNPASGADALEVTYEYDQLPEVLPSDPSTGRTFGPTDPLLYRGQLVTVRDRGSISVSAVDGRGRSLQTWMRMAKPASQQSEVTTLDARYAPRWYHTEVDFDAADREVASTTGARSTRLRGSDGLSRVTTEYSRRGTVRSVGGSFGSLIGHIERRADGLPLRVELGDAARTTTDYHYDQRRRLSAVQTYRGPPTLWSSPGYPADDAAEPTHQLILQDSSFEYDAVDNPTVIRDWRNQDEWPAGAKPSTRKVQYDDLYRLTRIAYEHHSTANPGEDAWTDPFAADAVDPDPDGPGGLPKRATPAPRQTFSKRVQEQSFRFDWLGNTSRTNDDANGFYDRSLGDITNGAAPGTAANKPYQLAAATGPTGKLSAQYDDAGNLTQLLVDRDGNCQPVAKCSNAFGYEWDEVGRLSRARRWDFADINLASPPVTSGNDVGLADVELQYTYDSANERVLKTAVDETGQEIHAVYIFDSLELRRTEFDNAAGEYNLTEHTEVPYLFANGVRVARVAWDQAATQLPGAEDGQLRVFLELSDELGSTSFILDKATSELVEYSTYQAFGGPEADYRPSRWRNFREDYRFTGKEDDIEVGLQYFGARYYAPLLGRWVSADPLTIHSFGSDLNAYAYVSGHALQAVDPLGLWGVGDFVDVVRGVSSGVVTALTPAGPIIEMVSKKETAEVLRGDSDHQEQSRLYQGAKGATEVVAGIGEIVIGQTLAVGGGGAALAGGGGTALSGGAAAPVGVPVAGVGVGAVAVGGVVAVQGVITTATGLRDVYQAVTKKPPATTPAPAPTTAAPTQAPQATPKPAAKPAATASQATPKKTNTGQTQQKKAAQAQKNKSDGIAREEASHAELQAQNPGKRVQREHYLRDKHGKIVKDPVTGEARRVDHAILDDKTGTARLAETTSKTAPKGRQSGKEPRIKKNGGRYVRDHDKPKQLFKVQGRTRIIRKK